MVLKFPHRAQAMTPEDFERFADLPHNRDRMLEFIGGDVYESRSNVYASIVSSRLSRRLGNWVEARDLGYLSSKGRAYRVLTDRYIPDIAYLSSSKRVSMQGFNADAPDLAVEVDYPSDAESQRRLRLKVSHYLAAGTVAWLVFPESRMVEVHQPGQAVTLLAEGDLLEGGTVLPEFSMAVKDIFPPLPLDDMTAE